MGFKTDISFLQKLTMGASATRSVIQYLQAAGFSAVELERYSTSNKIWSTKVKRLRLPDVLCARTGIRFEVRGKSDLSIKMSHSDTRPWDANVRDQDLVALVASTRDASGMVACSPPVFLEFRDLRTSRGTAKLGDRKSNTEGAERDLTWPSIVPTSDGDVVKVEKNRLQVRMSSGRLQSYALKGKTPYVKVGERFSGKASILAGSVRRLVDVRTLTGHRWSPLDDLGSGETADRYAASKAIAARNELWKKGEPRLKAALEKEEEERTRLEIAGALAKIGAARGLEKIAEILHSDDDGAPEWLRMEAVLLLSEVATDGAGAMLDGVASDRAFEGSELRQAAVWGLGKHGLKHYARLPPYLQDGEEDVVLHAIVAFGSDTPPQTVDALVTALAGAKDDRTSAAICEALVCIGSDAVAAALVHRWRDGDRNPWIAAALGRVPAGVLLRAALDNDLKTAIDPVRRLAADTNWLARSRTATDLEFLRQQTL